MADKGIIIQARTGSTRLPRKVILPFYKNQTILDVLLFRLKKANLGIKIIIATSSSKQDFPIQELADVHGVNCFTGSEKNVLLRVLNAAKYFNIEGIIRICADNPFLDTFFLKRLILSHQNEDYLSFQFSDGTPVIKSHLGLFAEATTQSALYKVLNQTTEQKYLEHVTNFIYTHSNSFSIKWLPVPFFLDQRKGLRFTTDTYIDFLMYQDIYSNLMELYSTDFSAKELVNLVENNRNWLDIMNKEILKNSK